MAQLRDTLDSFHALESTGAKCPNVDRHPFSIPLPCRISQKKKKRIEECFGWLKPNSQD
jgi:hypothetical protein